ncbi:MULTISPECIES: DUF4267 domain-containing protein [Streptomyces]|uniref:DUF4267 domain-containing protein n=1 Tax=Streptomyces TaxID=1883 RepID=UPI0004ABBAE9|nr:MULTISPECIES: DUF4267 domain-containing protein [Streptomyces]
MKRFTTVLTVLSVLFVLYIGLLYVLDPQGAASGFGLPSWPEHEGTGFLTVKGGRDIATGLGLFALLLTGHRKALGWMLLGLTAAPVTDMLTVLGNHGSAGTAFGVHGLTAAAVALNAVLLLRERPAPAAA